MYRTLSGPNSTVIQSGINSGGDDDRWANMVVEAVVLAVYYPSEDTRSWAAGTQKAITCDVRTLGLTPRFLHRVPVFQALHGLWDEDLYVPRAAAQDITGGALSTDGSSGPPTTAENMDADHVLVGFLQNSPNQPFIYPIQIPHPQSRRTVEQTAGRIRRIRFNGSILEIDGDGNVTIDATGAAKNAFGAKGVEVSNSGVGGIVTVKTKDAAGAVSSIVLDALGGIKITDGGGDFLQFTKSILTAELSAAFVNLATGPREPVLKGTSYVTAETVLYGILTTYFSNAAQAWAQIASKLPQIDLAGTTAAAAGAWAAAIATWVANATLAKSVKTQTG